MFPLILLHEGIPRAFITHSLANEERMFIWSSSPLTLFYYYKLAGSDSGVRHAKTFLSTLEALCA